MDLSNSLVQSVTWREGLEGKEIFADEAEITGGFGAVIHIKTDAAIEKFGKVPGKLHVIILEEL